jgi:hypothetical protein
MFQNVLDHCQTLDYGVWVSVSEKTYNEYYDNFDSGEHEGTYFGFLYNIPGYEQVLSLKTNVVIAKGTQRPEAIPHRSQLGSQFVTDYYEGISKEAAERRIRKFLEDHGLVLP